MEKLRVLDVIKLIDPNTFQPMINVTFQAALEPIQDEAARDGDEKAYASFGRELMKKIELAVPKRAPGLIIYNMDAPTGYASYASPEGDFRVSIEASSCNLDSLGELEDRLQAIAGPNADIFLYTLRSVETVDREMKRKVVYLIRFAYVSEEMRKNNRIEHCVSHHQGGF